ncbi:MAG: type II secretion system secretin GspD [Sideroxydans sp.]|nr:type II secretion system secretin GspD [Sideroxydans sp.]
MIWKKHIWLAALLLACSLPATAAQSDKVSLNFVNADIQEVIKAISQISKKNFLVDPRVKGSINIVSATPVSTDLAYDILLSALRLQGYAAVDADGVTKIIPESDAKLYVDAVGRSGGKGDKIITKVFVLKNESATQMVNVVRPMIAPNNLVVAHASSNALVITDYVSNLKRIEQVIRAIDLPSADAPIIIPVKYMSALDLANTINKMMPEAAQTAASGDGNQRFVLIGDTRSNSLLLRADNPGRIARVRELVAKLDNDTGTPGNYHVVVLKNADAAKLAQTLRAVMSGDTSAAPAAPGGTPTGGGMVQADVASNSLIITAAEPIYNNLRAVVERLDVRQPQVFVEALIVEVTADKAAELGVQWQALSQGSNTVFAGTNFGTTNNLITSATSRTIGQGFNLGILKNNSLGALAHALESDTNANILSSPNLMTLDNEEAKIVVGQNVPFITGSYSNTGSNATTATPFQTIERKDVGLTLKIKPQILDGGSVRLQIYQEVSSVLASSTSSTSGVTTNKRSIDTSVLVDKNQIVVLGGLIQDSVSDVQSKTPLLGDIPFLGGLFRYDTRQRTKTNLMVFIRPHIMLDKDSYSTVTSERYEQMSKKQDDAKLTSQFMMNVEGGPQLPEMRPSLKIDGGMPAQQSAQPETAK